MKKPYIIISVATQAATDSWAFGSRFLENLAQFDERLMPEFVSNGEPIKTAFAGVAAAEVLWAPLMVIRGPLGRVEARDSFMWKRKRRVKYYGHVMHTSVNVKNQKNLGRIIMRADVDDSVDWAALFRRICDLAVPKFGMLHLFTEQELIAADVGSPTSRFQNGTAGLGLESTVPNLAWATFLGDELAVEVDREKLLHHAFPLDSFGNGHLIRVTDNLSDVAERFEAFSERRALLKSLFRPGFIQIQ